MNMSHFQEKLLCLKWKKNKLNNNTYLKINLKNLVANFLFLKSKISDTTKFLGVVKAFGYGSDSIQIAKCLENHRIDYLAVAYTSEAIQLRENAIKIPILVLHPQIGDCLLYTSPSPRD